MRRSHLLILFLLVTIPGIAQQGIPKAMITWRNAVQQRDYLMGFDLGIANRSENLVAQVVFDFRPHSKKVQEPVGNNTFYQYSEKRYLVGLGLEYLHKLRESNKGVFAGLNGVYNFGNYRGVSYRPDQGWGVLPRAGLFWNLFQEAAYLKLGYQYLDSRSDDIQKHWLFLSFSIVLDPYE